MDANNAPKKGTYIGAVAPVALSLTAGAGLFAAAAWWLGEPTLRFDSLKPEVRVSVQSSVSPDAGASMEVRPSSDSTMPKLPPAVVPPKEKSVVIGLASKDPAADHIARAEEALLENNTKDAVLAFRHHVHHNPATFDVLLKLGRLARSVKQLRLSEAALKEARTLSPRDPEVHIQLSKTYIDLKQPRRARTAARAAVRLSPEEALSWNVLGRAEMAASSWEASELAFDRAITLDPANPHLYNNKGLLMIHMRRGEEAIEVLETAAALYAEELPHYVVNNLGLAFEMEDRLEDARGAFEQAIALSPFYVKAQVNLRRVDRALIRGLEAAAERVADASAEAVETPSP